MQKRLCWLRHHVYAFKALLQVQAQHRLPLPVRNDRFRTARPGTAFVQTVQLDAPAVDLNFLRRKFSESFNAACPT